MKQDVTEIEINGVKYVQKGTEIDQPKGEYVIIRSGDSGCHAGYLVSRTGSEVTLSSARRLWHWKGANTLSDIARDGVGKPKECRFPPAIAEITVLGVCEVIPATESARRSIEAVPAWKS